MLATEVYIYKTGVTPQLGSHFRYDDIHKDDEQWQYQHAETV